MFDTIIEAGRDAVAVLFPVDCAGCGAPDRALCGQCRSIVGGAPLVEQLLDDNTRVVSALVYEGIVRAMILGLKEEGRTDVVRALSRPVRAAIECAAESAAEPAGGFAAESAAKSAGGSAPGSAPNSAAGSRVEVCTVPASTVSRRRRGYRPVDLLVRAAGFRLAGVLKVSSLVGEQKFLDRAQRELNIHGAFVAQPSARGRKFVIVDDVVTTGATLQEAARALRAGGAEVVAAATLGFTLRRNGPKSIFLVSARDIHSEGRYGG